MSAALAPAAVTLSERLAGIIEVLCRAIAADGPRHVASAPLVVPTWSRLHRLLARFAALMAAVTAGRVRVSRSGPEGARRMPDRGPDAPASVRLPNSFGWLLRLVPHLGVRTGRSQLEHWLADPDLPALLEAEPQAGRVLRPLCRMLGISSPPALRLPPRPRRRRPAAPAPAGSSGDAARVPAMLPAGSALARWLKMPPSPPLPGLPVVAGAWTPFDAKADPPPD